MRIRTVLIILGLMLASPFILVALWIAYAVTRGSILQLMGYPVDVSPTELAQEIFDTHGNPLRCRQLQQSVPTMGPSLTEQRMLCFHKLAEISKDPTICEFLMPSSYGLSCVGAASEAPICGMNTGFEVQWREGDQIKRSSLKDCQKSNRRSERGDKCCTIASVSGIRNFNDCSSLAMDVSLFDNCLNELAFKNHDPSACASIRNPNIKAGCIVSAKALQKDPSICTGCTPPVESIDQLPR